MENVQEKVPEFRKTVVTEAIVKNIERGPAFNLLWVFDEYPILEVREAILSRLLSSSIKVGCAQEADWAETRIHDLKKEEEQTHSGSWKELLGWYIFNANGGLVNRALDFAIGITKLEHFGSSYGFQHRSDVLKIIAGRLNKSPMAYQDITTPDLKLFLESFLVKAYERDFPIYDCTMIDIKRVVHCAINVEDWTFLPLIEKVLYKLYNQKRPERYDFGEEVEILENITFLREAVRLFREKTEEVKDT
ncbi:MAG: hypothetical protein AAB577_01450 [Patescibacteria group bacterium]